MTATASPTTMKGPRHDELIRPFKLADRCVTNAEWIAFIEDGGYRTPTLWLADGWATVKAQDWSAPLYWEEADGGFMQMSLLGFRPLDPAAPVSHVSYYEADAFARWAGYRLPTEFEWEVAAGGLPRRTAARLARSHLRPMRAETGGAGLKQMFGDVWEWTASAYLPYPGFKAAPGAVGEYNGKFMCNQFVLRGGSCATPEGHIRTTYRNFFYPASALAVHGPAAGRRRLMERDIPHTIVEDLERSSSAPVPEARSGAGRFRRGRAGGLRARSRAASLAASSTTRAARALFEEITQLAGVLPDAGRDGAARGIWRRDRRAHGRCTRAGRVRLRLEPQDEPAVERAPQRLRSMCRSTSPARAWRKRRSGCPSGMPASPSGRSSPTSPRPARCPSSRAAREARLLLRLDHRQSDPRRGCEAFSPMQRACSAEARRSSSASI